jgi:hypothetical protein
MELVNNVLGMCGRMLSGSKSGYDKAHPGNVVVFNANVCTKKLGKIWFGDIDVTRDEAKLKELAGKLGEPVYVLYEQDARFENETNPKFDMARAVIDGQEVRINDRRW